MRKAMVVRAGRAIGNVLVEGLIKVGMDVIAYSGSQHKLSRMKEAFDHSPRLLTAQGDVRNADEMLVAADGVDVIYCGIYLTYDENAEKVQQMLKAIETVSSRTGAKVVIIEGVYRPSGQNKLLLANFDQRYLHLNSPELYGAGASNTIFHYSLKKIAKGQKVKVLGNPSVKREYLYLNDAAQYAVELALKESSYGKTWRLRGGSTVSTEALLTIAASTVNIAPRFELISDWKLRLLRAYEPRSRALLDRYESNDWNLQEYELEYIGSGQVTTHEAAIAETINGIMAR
ncbi:hypothetical protein OB236_22880 [Paenibacillus sp. WQ 127069]|uniref:NAD-dependent epimerase/dehydratase domain-containing protein n=1 Tax=Paenibacillus baimaensis TaxID=2982185 RepID=A0ABT2UJY3_9BACL|nr:NAD-dependent epimerase/dehydratase family protein [Paenibacillus sp. WQ 127069]MCU6794956.1 hypothetical protein [Paenibacillus sp. WQ 127069]